MPTGRQPTEFVKMIFPRLRCIDLTENSLANKSKADATADEPISIDGRATAQPFFVIEDDPVELAATRRRRVTIQIALVIGYVALCGWLVGPWFALFLVGIPAILIGAALWLSRRNAYRHKSTKVPMAAILTGLIMVTTGGLLAAREGGPPTYQPPLDIPTVIAPRPSTTTNPTGTGEATGDPSLRVNPSGAPADEFPPVNGEPAPQAPPPIWDEPLPLPGGPIPLPGQPAPQNPPQPAPTTDGGGWVPPAPTVPPPPPPPVEPPPATQIEPEPPVVTEPTEPVDPPAPIETTEPAVPIEATSEDSESLPFLG